MNLSQQIRQAAAARKAIFARTPTGELVKAAAELDGLSEPTHEQRLALSWTLEEIERRFPRVKEAFDAAFAVWEEHMKRTGEDLEFDQMAIVRAAIAESGEC